MITLTISGPKAEREIIVAELAAYLDRVDVKVKGEALDFMSHVERSFGKPGELDRMVEKQPDFVVEFKTQDE